MLHRKPVSGEITANIVSIQERTIRYGTLIWEFGQISRIDELGEERPGAPYLIPGFVDAHLHIESAHLPPAEFSRLALPRGTLACVVDPHELCNVMGLSGFDFMYESAQKTALEFLWGAPSCVPGHRLENHGLQIGLSDVERLLDEGRAGFLAEVMDVEGVLNRSKGIMAKILATKLRKRPIDGHAPGLSGTNLRKYRASGIQTDHECSTLDEALEKLDLGFKILIREGSAARDLDALESLIRTHPDEVMLCTDDLHPDDLASGHMDALVRRAMALGHDFFDVLKVSGLNAVRHYGLPLGQLGIGERMDAVLISDPKRVKVQKAWIRGQLVAEDGASKERHRHVLPIGGLKARPLQKDDFRIPKRKGDLRVLVVEDGSLATQAVFLPALFDTEDLLIAQPGKDILWMVLVNRYRPQKPVLGMVRGFGLDEGAIATSYAHDAHHIVAVGVDPGSIVKAVNALIERGGGLSRVSGDQLDILPLPIAGLMSPEPAAAVANHYQHLNEEAQFMGSTLKAPYMQLAFLALPVIGDLKLTSEGLFDVKAQRLVGLF